MVDIVSGNTEIELKLAVVSPDVWEDLLQAPVLTALAEGAPSQETLEAWYYDTDNRLLQQSRLAFRIRREGGKWVATVKGGGTSAGGLHQRQEFNVVVPKPEPSLECFKETPLGRQLNDVVGDKPLIKQFITRFERRTLMVRTDDGSRIEVAADRGEIIAGELRAPILELELELKAGQAAALLKLGAQLAQEFPLLVEPRSKYFRGLCLSGAAAAERRGDANVSASNCRGCAAGEGLQRVLVGLISQVLQAQAEFIGRPADSLGIHNFRVELRRLRSLLVLARPLIKDKQECTGHEAQLRKLAQKLGPVREHDVLHADWQNCIDSGVLKVEEDVLGKLLAASRHRQERKLTMLLLSGQSTAVLLALWGWLLEQPFDSAKSDFNTLSEFVAVRLRRWLKLMLKAGQKTDLGDVNSVHGLRIRGKKLWYGLECFQFLLGAGSGKVTQSLRILQDELGYLHDMFYTETFLRKLLVKSDDRELHWQAGMLLGWQSRESEVVRNCIPKYWKDFRRTGRNWLKE